MGSQTFLELEFSLELGFDAWFSEAPFSPNLERSGQEPRIYIHVTWAAHCFVTKTPATRLNLYLMWEDSEKPR